MAMGARLDRPRVVAVGAAVIGIALLVALPGPARAGFGATCAITEATFAPDPPGTALRFSAGYEDASADTIGYAYKGTDAVGDPLTGSGSCSTGGSWQALTIEVGDRADEVRLDAVKPKPQQADPIPQFVDVTIRGGAGPDVLRGHKGRDNVYGESGGDVIRIAGGGADVADCGGGNDKAIVKGLDQSVDCEQVVVER